MKRQKPNLFTKFMRATFPLLAAVVMLGVIVDISTVGGFNAFHLVTVLAVIFGYLATYKHNPKIKDDSHFVNGISRHDKRRKK